MTQEQGKPYFMVQTVERALLVLDQLIAERKPLSVTELSRRLKLHKSIVHRLLATLSHYKYVEQDSDSEKYRIGFRSFQLGAAYIHSTSLIEESRELIEQLMNEVSANAHLAILHQGLVLYVLNMEPTSSSSVYQYMGVQNLVHFTALGKCLCAWKTEPEVLDILAQRGMSPRTSRTITEPASYLEELAHVRKQGYAMDNEEASLGIRCFAAPIFDYSGQVAAAVSVSGSTKHFPNRRIPEVAHIVMRYGRLISMRLGYIAPES